ncbi:protocadherin beta-16-like [Phascolarctos cinereus]|uniref:Protocadherin gamma-C3 n=1 Tax=Phascolarctos cinereus TaxID=38626 RepID=A0A6P5LX90_PHACI|nr:protocadherin beta-16-like [Phascolarctos cinereus]
MAPAPRETIRQVLFVYIFLYGGFRVACETIRYSIAEEIAIGSFVANFAKDLGLNVKELRSRQARLVEDGNGEHFLLDLRTGELVTKDRIDREEICAQMDECIVRFELLLQNPLRFFRAEVVISDINDHSPEFPEDEFILKIPELTTIGTRFPLESAQDLDTGKNTLQNYTLIPISELFVLQTREGSDGSKYPELLLAKALDREEHPELEFVLTAVDGGIPPSSGTAKIRIVVLDANDNAPVFSQSLYRATVAENSPVGFVVTIVSAADSDQGSNGEVTYSFSQNAGKGHRAFQIDPLTGEIRISKFLDFEMIEKYELSVRATDGGGLSSHCKVLVEVVDVNDNPPEVTVTSLSTLLPEDSLSGTVVALFSIRDRDSGDHGRASCSIPDDIPFILKPTFSNYYELVTDTALDRERVSSYNITITAVDWGSPSLSAWESVTVQILDINDNLPLFNQSSYTMYVTENNRPSLMIGGVNATDSDSGQNAKVTYSIWSENKHSPFSSPFISINSENGQVYILKTLDYEEIKDFKVTVQASDSGSPSLSTNVTVYVVIVDENDNAPVILYPMQNHSSSYSELIPRTAEEGYLVTKVVAVDEDSGQNSWLSYQLLKATDPGLFIVWSHNGEVRTSRTISDRDAIKQKLIILVRDNGVPILSTPATLDLLLVDGFSEAHMHVPDSTEEEKQDSTLTVYLIISLALISFLFLVSIIIFIIIKVYKRKQLKERSHCAGHFDDVSNFPKNLVDVTGTGNLFQTYKYDMCLTDGSGNSEFKILKPVIPSLPPQLENSEIFPEGN